MSGGIKISSDGRHHHTTSAVSQEAPSATAMTATNGSRNKAACEIAGTIIGGSPTSFAKGNVNPAKDRNIAHKSDRKDAIRRRSSLPDILRSGATTVRRLVLGNDDDNDDAHLRKEYYGSARSSSPDRNQTSESAELLSDEQRIPGHNDHLPGKSNLHVTKPYDNSTIPSPLWENVLGDYPPLPAKQLKTFADPFVPGNVDLFSHYSDTSSTGDYRGPSHVDSVSTSLATAQQSHLTTLALMLLQELGLLLLALAAI
ncbi:hypothetical protein BGX28_007741 [Mortierella sp. GBA30]|nr:hypothetical protein BGX28_007741 [Mortierella sp. GBA30]